MSLPSQRWCWISSVTGAFCSPQICPWKPSWHKQGINILCDGVLAKAITFNAMNHMHCDDLISQRIQVLWFRRAVIARRGTEGRGEGESKCGRDSLRDNEGHPDRFYMDIGLFIELQLQVSQTLILQIFWCKGSRSFSWMFVPRWPLLTSHAFHWQFVQAFEVLLCFLRCGARKIPPGSAVCAESIGAAAQVL